MLLEAAQAAYLVQSFNEAACLDLVLLARLDFSVADPGSGTTPVGSHAHMSSAG